MNSRWKAWCAVLVLAACAHSNPDIGAQMKRIDSAYASAQASTTLSDFQASLATIEDAAHVATNLPYNGSASDAEKYKNGMNEVLQTLDAVDQAAAKGDLAGAKGALSNLEKLRSKWHLALGV
jgi:soluble cytochrome b562